MCCHSFRRGNHLYFFQIQKPRDHQRRNHQTILYGQQLNVCLYQTDFFVQQLALVKMRLDVILLFYRPTILKSFPQRLPKSHQGSKLENLGCDKIKFFPNTFVASRLIRFVQSVHCYEFFWYIRNLNVLKLYVMMCISNLVNQDHH